ncbi:branched-chain amino acid ABC transporter permease [Aeromicrobium alkaliterrae]|uniref:Branched-chain amino acid ABC transporter permease n=1 Tax=Aeromicrobium alkaliterrae TaxID=302168 RepID=A0ABN2K8E1_9ACTN
MTTVKRLGLLAWVVAVVVLLAAPFGVDRLTLDLLLDVAIMAVVVMSSNLLTGVTGQISLAQGAMLGFGAYTAAVLVNSSGWSPAATLPVAIAVGAAVGALAGLPALRISGIQLALVTLAIAMVFPTLVLRLGDAGGGPNGLILERGIQAPAWFPYPSAVFVYWLLIAITVVVFILARNLIGSRVGRMWLSIRDHELLASATGVNVQVHKLSCFTVSGGLAGLAGWMFTIHHEFVSPADFGLFLSINILLAMVVGGRASVLGPILGAVFLRLSTEGSTEVGVSPLLVPVVQGAVLILVLLMLPRGLADLPRTLRRRRPAKDGGSDDPRPPSTTSTPVKESV